MQNLLNDLIDVLKQDERFTIEGKLLKNKVIEAGLQLDPKLIKYLLSDENIKKVFFQDIEGIMVFDKIKFQKFISNKQFLPDSYTEFKNRIGLTADSEYLSDNKEVVLDWAYKDCILEGGQDKEDSKRQEIFWNETLAPNDIDRLLYPKVLTNFKLIGSDEVTDIQSLSSENNYIFKGNNLLVLHTIKSKFKEKVKLIYIDPPYNTNNDSFGYNDSFKHSTWLTFMKNRLEIAKQLLSPSGVIFVQISDVRVAHLKILMDEIFGVNNFINQITVKTKSPSGFKTVNLGVFETAEYILAYGKDKKKWSYNPQYTKAEYDENYKYEIENISESPDNWKICNIEDIIAKQEGYLTGKDAKKIIGKEVFLTKVASYAQKNANKVFRFTEINDDAGKETIDTKKHSIANPDKVFVVSRSTKDNRYIINGNEIYFYGKKLREVDGELVPTMLLTNIWTDIAYEGIANEGGVKLKKGKKPEKLLRRIISMATQEGDLVLDFHLGSGTTCAVAHKMNRKYIGIEQLDYGQNDGVIRLKNVINGDKTGVSKLEKWTGGGSFVLCELKKANQIFIDEILVKENDDELCKLWAKMQKNAFISYKVTPQSIASTADSFESLSIEEKKRFLIEVLDKNMLYINLSDIENNDFSVSDEEKRLTNLFYSMK